jgi:hypothetical protein
MTGMPAWGATHDDSAIWPVVAFMTRLPALDETAYEAMLQSASGHGHHAEDEANNDPSHDVSDESPVSNVHVHDDGSAHVHEAPASSDNDDDDSAHEHNNL